jgi:hypothetical protein
MTRYAAILTIQEKKIIVKELETGFAMPYQDLEKLDSFEQKHFNLFQMYFPLNVIEVKSRTRKYLDSMISIYPQLSDAKYYRFLIDKTNSFGDEKYSYTVREIPLSKRKYKYFVELINHSGYWKMKPYIDDCPGVSTHPDCFSLEAATLDKYNYVYYVECGENDNSKLAHLFNEIKKISGLDENMNSWHNKLYKDD